MLAGQHFPMCVLGLSQSSQIAFEGAYFPFTIGIEICNPSYFRDRKC